MFKTNTFGVVISAVIGTLLIPTIMPSLALANQAPESTKNNHPSVEHTEELISTDYQALVLALRGLDEADALTQLQLFVQQQPDHRDAKLALAQIALGGNEYNVAVQAVESLCSGKHPDWYSCYLTGTAYLGTQDHHNARTYLDAALEQDDAQAQIWLHIAVLEQEMGNHTAALHYLNIAKDLAPGNNQILLNQAYSYENIGQFDSALTAYQQYLARSTTSISTIRPKVLRQIAQISQERQRLLARSLEPTPSAASTTP